MPTLRSQPYIWATWISKFLAGDNSCEWATWYKAHYELPSRSKGNMDEWRIKHTSLLQRMRRNLAADGSQVFVEDQNTFRLKGRSATLSGKPDLIATGNEWLICDVKTGQPRTSDRIQVMIYMYAIPRALPQYKGVKFAGLVAYEDDHDYIAPDAIDDCFIDNLTSLIMRVSAEMPAERVPSVRECRFCDLTSEFCEMRMEATIVEGETTDF